MTAVLGKGIYSYSEAARLLGTDYRQIGGWFNARSASLAPVLTPDFADIQGPPSISFLDLIDASVALKLKQSNVSTQRIRKLHDELARLWKTDHPFSRQELYVDQSGKRIFSRARRGTHDEFLEVLEKQHAIPEVLTPFLKRVEYSPESLLARKLWLTRNQDILIDPKRRYGKPITELSGMPTAILYDCYISNGMNYEFVADWCNVDVDEVKGAVAFEESFVGIAA